MACPTFVSAQSGYRDGYCRIYTERTGTDFYHYYQDGGYQRYLVSAAAIQGFTCITGKDSLTVEYQRSTLAGKYGQLHEPEDFIKLEMPVSRLKISPSWRLGDYQLSPQFSVGDGFGMNLHLDQAHKIGLLHLELGVQQHHAEVSYRIGREGGNIPFAWNLAQAGLKGRLGAYNRQAKLYGIFPGKGDSLFDNRIYGLAVAYDLQRQIKGNYLAKLISFYEITQARLNYREEEYGKLDNLQMAYLGLSMEKQGDSFDAELKLHTCLTGSGNDTYFDIWPFTYWDTFLASRTRLKKLQMYLISPELSGTWKWGKQSSNGWHGSLGMSYNHLFHHEDVIHKNRIVILYPFFYGYETFRYDWHDELDACVRIPLKLGYRLSKGNIELSLLQALPFRWSKLFARGGSSGPEEPDADKTWQWGGLSCVLQLNLLF